MKNKVINESNSMNKAFEKYLIEYTNRYLTDNTELKELILQNPTLPLLFFATDEANSVEYQTESCSVDCYIGEVLDYEYSDKIYLDRDDFEEDIADTLWDDFLGKTHENCNDEFENYVEQEIKKYEQYWKDCIIVICG